MPDAPSENRAPGLWEEFKRFALRGHVLDMAIGVVIGGAFGKIVASLVGDILTPALGALTGGLDVKEWAVSLRTPAGGPAVTLKYGAFLSSVLDFGIIALSLFVVIKMVNKITRGRVLSTEPPK